MGKLKIIKSAPLATIQDKGRFGFRKYGIPQSGAMDLAAMARANKLVGNEENFPVLEFALMGMKLQSLENTIIGISGADIIINGVTSATDNVQLKQGDILETTPPHQVYAYLAFGGQLKVCNDFGSYSTYLMAGFGGYQGRNLAAGDILETQGKGQLNHAAPPDLRINPEEKTIHIMKGPEWHILEESLNDKVFQIHHSSNRMGIRLQGAIVTTKISEITSSAVIPGTIQLTPNSQLIVLMNDCQTTGGYPRIAKVTDKHLGKLAQTKPNKKITLKTT